MDWSGLFGDSDSGLLGGMSANSGLLTGLGVGLLSGNDWRSGLANAFQQGNLGGLADTKLKEKKKADNARKAYLAAHPELDQATRDYAANNDEAAQAIFQQQISPKQQKPQAEYGVIGEDAYGNKQYGWVNPYTQEVKAAGGSGGVTSVGTPMMDGAPPGVDKREWRRLQTQRYAKEKAALDAGYQKGSPEYNDIVLDRKPNSNQSGPKLPAGFAWNNPNNPQEGMYPIEGGPGTQLSAEVGARLGLAKSYLGQSEGIKKAVKEGALDGPDGKIAMTLGVGKAGALYRKIQSGKDALVRNMTGAGMNIAEAEEYASRYLPGLRDTSDQMLDKLDQLDRELQSTGEMVGRGRGGNPLAGAGGPKSTANQDPYGIR
jgi:hypothetical protein